jgi:hypothetical protein
MMRGRCRSVAKALGQAKQSRNDTAHGPDRVNGLCSKSTQAPVAVSASPAATRRAVATGNGMERQRFTEWPFATRDGRLT